MSCNAKNYNIQKSSWLQLHAAVNAGSPQAMSMLDVASAGRLAWLLQEYSSEHIPPQAVSSKLLLALVSFINPSASWYKKLLCALRSQSSNYSSHMV
jgi:hypothetical protein